METTINRKALKWFVDPCHGWLRVDLEDILKLRLIDKISQYSYIKGKYAYLEEDYDALLFATAANLSFKDMKGKTIKVNNCNNRSSIRDYTLFNVDAFSWHYNKRKTK